MFKRRSTCAQNVFAAFLLRVELQRRYSEEVTTSRNRAPSTIYNSRNPGFGRWRIG